MNILVILLNRIYFFLTKVKNQNPFFGSVILVSLLISFTILNLQMFYYSFKPEYIITDVKVGLFLMLIVFVYLYFYATKKKVLITEREISNISLKNLITIIFILSTILSTIYFANINRSKIEAETDKKLINKNSKESLEEKIKKAFE